MDPAALVDAFHHTLAGLGSAERAASMKAYLKSDLDFLGVRMPALRAEVKALARGADLRGEALRAVVDELWSAPVFECRMAACELLAFRSRDLVPADLPRLERMLRQSGTWALVDHLVGNAVAPLLDAQRDLLPVLGRWAVDDDLWIRRAAILSLLPFLKRGEQWPRFERLAEPMLDDPGFFIRKVLGWVLRDAARKHPDRTADWLRPRVHRVSGLTFREATRKLPRELRAELEALRG